MNHIQIGKRWVGTGQPCFIIAEAGSNHNRQLKQAFRLIDAAAAAGCDSVKFQTFKADKIYSRKTPMATYLKKNKLVKKGETIWDVIKKNELPREWHRDLAAYCRSKKILFLSTPFDLEAVDELEKVGVPAYKIASFEITHLPLLSRVAETKKPVILSTGMANLDDIEVALDTIYKKGNQKVILLHCAINYPPKFEDVHLKAMDTLQQAFQTLIGYSDHTMGYVADVVAVARGACVIEKHFTTSRQLKGPDHPFALEPDELKEMVSSIRTAEKTLGSPIKRHTEAEQELYQLARRSLVAAKHIEAGTKLTKEMIDVKRPGYGIPTKLMDVVVGRKAKRNIEEDEILTWEMI
ncbi:MAG: N-acetylneuraminate synthase [Candidatus Omnitrophica bacterium CG11_big_fil_rev_8_21_14_0_20_45_26]|uniref:N-acetylneuraminate synthase n=1 Tax=Candidatus Abzuiibacterium crystallinum TaxID=1974748 RepID=A0A2H0LLE7_9BACT|nr:MAG: N-acetylneuraminate synthase [Candidatus Omnitrophica bacterium CG11_big_fil_rev_8_21_14_0_20_45_26]PIW65403.1 MAG: N-acetylneuraminate synthase [Candidatus Omnitrophica bacterium CG12_big_fil_rev_8_21_14_0_65_45_16]